MQRCVYNTRHLRLTSVWLCLVKPFRIAVLVSTDTTYLRGVLGGIGEFSRTRADWRIVTRPWLIVNPTMPPAEPCDGAIVYFPSVLEQLDPPPVAAVSVSERFGDGGHTLVCPDSAEIGRAAAQHLLGNGFRQFAFIGYPDTPFVARRLKGFMETVREVGRDVDAYQCSGAGSTIDERRLIGLIKGRKPAHSWDAVPAAERKRIREWLAGLPKPVGILCATDVFALLVIDCCRDLGITVPGDVALVGVDNDALACDYASPSLSSVDPNAREVGRRAAEVLHNQLQGGGPPAEPIRVPPLGVVVRQSSDCFAVAAPNIQSAMRFIRQHACEPISVGEIADRCHVPRRTLEKACRELIGRSPWSEIRRIRLDRARELLIRTDKTIRQIADETGFSEGRVLTSVFHKHVGITPTEFRRQNRPR